MRGLGEESSGRGLGEELGGRGLFEFACVHVYSL